MRVLTPAGRVFPLRSAKGSGPAGVARLLACLTLAVATPAAAGVLAGRIRFEGTPPARPTVYMNADPMCDKVSPNGRPSDQLVVDAAGGIANVLVYVKGGVPKQSDDLFFFAHLIRLACLSERADRMRRTCQGCLRRRSR